MFSSKKSIEIPDLSDEEYLKLVKYYMCLKRKLIYSKEYIQLYIQKYFKTDVKDYLTMYIKSSTGQGLLIEVCKSMWRQSLSLKA